MFTLCLTYIHASIIDLLSSFTFLTVVIYPRSVYPYFTKIGLPSKSRLFKSLLAVNSLEVGLIVCVVFFWNAPPAMSHSGPQTPTTCFDVQVMKYLHFNVHIIMSDIQTTTSKLATTFSRPSHYLLEFFPYSEAFLYPDHITPTVFIILVGLLWKVVL